MNKDDLIIDIESNSDSANDVSEEEVVFEMKTTEEAPVADVTEPKAQEKEEVSSKKKFVLSVYDIVSVVMSSFVIIAIVFTFVFRLVGVDGSSMADTLHGGDWLLTVHKSEYEYGDIVVVTDANALSKPLIKRVIATGGQEITIDTFTDTVYVDGNPLDEPYTLEDEIDSGGIFDYPYTVPEGHLFCMGDNRNASTDSRVIGTIDERHILGKAVVRIFPFGAFDIYDYE